MNNAADTETFFLLTYCHCLFLALCFQVTEQMIKTMKLTFRTSEAKIVTLCVSHCDMEFAEQVGVGLSFGLKYKNAHIKKKQQKHAHIF